MCATLCADCSLYTGINVQFRFTWPSCAGHKVTGKRNISRPSSCREAGWMYLLRCLLVRVQLDYYVVVGSNTSVCKLLCWPPPIEELHGIARADAEYRERAIEPS